MSLAQAGSGRGALFGAEVLAGIPHTLHHVLWQVSCWLHRIAASKDELPLPVLHRFCSAKLNEEDLQLDQF